MNLPNHQDALAPEEKITKYLLSFTHRDGRSKAKFFARFGFSADNWSEMASVLKRHAAEHEVSQAQATPFGTRYVVEGSLQAPDGRRPAVRSIWFVKTGAAIPRFVTAYPLSRRST